MDHSSTTWVTAHGSSRSGQCRWRSRRESWSAAPSIGRKRQRPSNSTVSQRGVGRSLNVAVRTDDSDSEDALGLITPSSDDDDEQVASGTPAPRVEVPVPLEAPHTLTRPSALAKESLTPVSAEGLAGQCQRCTCRIASESSLTQDRGSRSTQPGANSV